VASPWWYLRRAVPWAALLGCCAVAVALTAAIERWPSSAAALLPAVLGFCAAAGGFVFDEDAAAVTTVTPRARWRLGLRCAAALLPLGVWAAVVLVRPGDLPLPRSAWWLVGAAVVLVAVGAAAVASRLGQPAPGSLVAALVGLSVFAPVVVGPLVGWPSPYPAEALTAGVRTFWLCVAGAGLVGCLVALRRA
jgi:hypothetical protein